LIHESDVDLILRSRFSGVSKDESWDASAGAFMVREGASRLLTMRVFHFLKP